MPFSIASLDLLNSTMSIFSFLLSLSQGNLKTSWGVILLVLFTKAVIYIMFLTCSQRSWYCSLYDSNTAAISKNDRSSMSVTPAFINVL